MNRKQLLLLVGVAVVVLVAGLLMNRSRKQVWEQGQGDIGGLVLPDFPVNDVTQIKIAGPDGAVTLLKKESGWCVAERYGYAADYAAINIFMRELLDLKVAQSVQVGPSQYGRLNLADAGGAGQSGTQVDFLGADGATLARLILGKEHMRKADSQQPAMMGMPAGGYPDGRYVRVPADAGDGLVALVNKTFSSIRPEAVSWLDKQFFKTGTVVKASLAAEGKTLWTLDKVGSASELTLVGLADGQETDAAKVRSVVSAFSYASFVDVADPALGDEATGFDQARTFTAEAEDGLVYTVSIGKETADGQYYVKVSVETRLPEIREAADVETEEDKAKADAEFATKRAEKVAEAAALNARLGGWIYLMREYSVKNVLLERGELIKKAEKAE